jgi:hypothetical protein
VIGHLVEVAAVAFVCQLARLAARRLWTGQGSHPDRPWR